MIEVPRFLPAPLEGVMTPALIRAATELRLVDGWMTPFLRVSQGGVPRPKRLGEFLEPFAAAGVPVWVQIMGTDPATVAAAAERALELGAAGVNLNFGCPSRQVCSGGAGGGAWKRPETIAAIASAVRERLPEADLSLKIRSGWSDPGEIALLPELIAAARPDWIVFHYRTVAEQYRMVEPAERLSRWRRAVELARPVPVWINGDLAGLAEAEAAVADSGAAGAMAGRGWLRDPWFFRRPAAPGAEEGRELFWRTALQMRPALSPGQRIELGKWLFGRIIRDLT